MKIGVFVMCLIGLLTAGCNEQTVQVVDEHGKVVKTYKIERPSMKLNPNCTTVIEECEYFVVDAYGTCTYVHKGNCKNPIHIHNGGNHE